MTVVITDQSEAHRICGLTKEMLTRNESSATAMALAEQSITGEAWLRGTELLMLRIWSETNPPSTTPSKT